MPNYLNGKIYTIRSYQTDNVYVGSTTQTLADRMKGHRKDFKCYKKGTGNFVSSFEILKYDDAYIELVILNPCNSKTELDAVEGQYIRKMECVNKNIAGRSRKEYRMDNSDRLNEISKQYYLENKESIKERKSQYYIDNRDKINEYKNQKHTCICGGKYTTGHKSQHLKTKKHQLYITMKKQKPKPKTKLTKITDFYKPSVNSSVILVL
jgi:hypothetical protein